jgi:hypothetical protein
MCEHLLAAGIWMSWTEAAGCEVPLSLLQRWQLLTHLAISDVIPRHTTLAVIHRLVALVPGWASLWMATKTCCRSASGMRGLVIPLAVSHKTLTPSLTTGCMDSTGDLSMVSVRAGELVGCYGEEI